LITDAVMPEMGGAELAAQFLDSYPGVPVLCMSGYSDIVWPEVDDEASYIQKPFTPAVLLTRVRALLDRYLSRVEQALSPANSDRVTPALQ
jgi:FixJ family two-component response regulator